MGESSRSPLAGVFGSEMHVRPTRERTAGTADRPGLTAPIAPRVLHHVVSPKHLHPRADLRPSASTPVEPGARYPLTPTRTVTVQRAVCARRIPSARVHVAA
jgi:hypothetical protein